MAARDRFHHLLSQAWKARFAARLDAARELARELDALVTRDPKAEAERLALHASFARAEGDTERGETLLRRARALDGASFQVALQSGLNGFGRGDFATALDHFLAARSLAKTPLQRMSAIGNALFCLDNLGADLTEARRDARRALARLPRGREDWGARAALDCFELRQAFRAGRLPGWGRLRGIGTQAGYFQIWVSELPYAPEPGRYRAEITRLVWDREPLYQKSYRFRTLQGVFVPDDLQTFSIKEAADRIYLWTWRWLASPGEVSLETIGRHLEALHLCENFSRLTSEDYRMLRNALGWIALYFPRRAARWESWIRKFRPNHLGQHPLFDYEYLWIARCQAQRAGERARAENARAALAEHPLAQADLSLARLASADVPPALWRLQAQARLNAQPPLLRIDTASASIETEEGVIVSEPLARALALLSTESAVPVASFVAHCFGYRRYDPITHNARVYSLLARARAVLQAAQLPVTVGLKDGAVFRRGEWRGVEVALSEAEPEIALERSTPPAKATRAPKGLSALRAREKFRRADVEAAAGISKSAAHRLLQEWLREGRVVADGRGKRLQYRWRFDSRDSSH